MDKLKLLRLQQDQPAIDLTSIRTVPAHKAQQLLTAICDRTGLGKSNNGLSLVRHLRQQSRPLVGMDANQPDFALARAFEEAGISPGDRVFINWHRFDDLDDVSTETVTEHFDQFWYPKADDIDIFDGTLTWFLSVDSEGSVWVARI